MSFSVGIVGLPNVGKSTLFKALTKNKVDIAAYPFTTVHPNVGVVTVPDERLDKIANVIKPEKTTPTIIEFVDIAGLVKGAHKGEGLGNQFLAQIRNCNAILEVVRAFEDPNVEHVTGKIQPESDIETVKIELLMKDLETIENLISKAGKDVKTKDKKAVHKLNLLEKIQTSLSQEKLVSEIDLTEEEKEEIKEYQLLTQKPIFYILNTDSGIKTLDSKFEHLAVNLKNEEEISELTENEIKELEFKTKLDQLILACYNILDLITFYTITGGKETRAWTLKRGLRAPAAGGVVHSDFEEKFIRAEVINWQKLVEAQSWKEVRESGLLKTAGKDYIVQDGDVIEFKI
jgi:GTP-binding protein YchF